MESLLSPFLYHQTNLATPGRPWHPGFWRNFPTSGLVSIILATLCGVAAAVVLAVSDGMPINTWRIAGHSVQPTVLLAIFTTLANGLLDYGFANGRTIAWWIKAFHGGKVADLHRRWAHGDSIVAAITSGRHFRRMAMAKVLMIVLLIDGPLLQRASTVVSIQRVDQRNMSVPISSSPFLVGASGILADHDYLSYPTLYSSVFAKVVQQYIARDPITLSSDICNGTCTTEILGAGWDVDCTTIAEPYSLMTPDQWMESQNNQNKTYKGPPRTQVMFGVNVTFQDGLEAEYSSESLATAAQLTNPSDLVKGNHIRISSRLKNSTGYTGSLLHRQCLLREAVVRYPIHITNNILTLSSLPITTNRTEHLVIQQTDTNGQANWPSTCGGFFVYLMNTFTATANLTTVGGWSRVTTYSPTARNYLNNIQIGDTLPSEITWNDPTDDMINTLHELSLRTVIATSRNSSALGILSMYLTSTQQNVISPNMTNVNRTLSQTVPVTITYSETVYQSHFHWLVGGILAIFFACFGLIPIYYGWWNLGRPVSMSPIEVAKAFDAPLLREGDAAIGGTGIPADENATVNELIAVLGSKRVQYGAVIDSRRTIRSGGIHRRMSSGIGGRTIKRKSLANRTSTNEVYETSRTSSVTGTTGNIEDPFGLNSALHFASEQEAEQGFNTGEGVQQIGHEDRSRGAVDERDKKAVGAKHSEKTEKTEKTAVTTNPVQEDGQRYGMVDEEDIRMSDFGTGVFDLTEYSRRRLMIREADEVMIPRPGELFN